jgi:hypothetical protein
MGLAVRSGGSIPRSGLAVRLSGESVLLSVGAARLSVEPAVLLGGGEIDRFVPQSGSGEHVHIW